ncbi:ANTAR domain-containing protein OS=Streptomyces alboniger OX=132473 GN=CP975_12235 PE=4 SV=1 [Streptomyces alboniger]
MNREEQIARTFVELADTLTDDFDVIDVLRQLSLRCRELLDVADAAVLLATPGTRSYTPVAYDHGPKLAALLDVALREGPAFEAHRTAATVAPGDLALAPAAWREFTGLARHAGYTHAVAVPLRLRKDTLGSLLLLGTGDGPLPAADLALAQAFAEAAAIGLLHAHTLQQADTVNEQLHTALHSRVLIEQAKGFIAASRGITFSEAFEILRSHARAHRLPLATAAQQVVDSTGLPQPPAPARRPGQDVRAD